MHRETHLVKVKDVVYRVIPSGRIMCILVLDKTVKIAIGENSIEYEVIRLESREDVVDYNINKGQVLKVTFSYTNLQDIQTKIVAHKFSMRANKEPTHCGTCKSKLVIKHSSLYCPGHFCEAKSRTSIKRLFLQNCEGEASPFLLDNFDRYLDHFPTWDGNAEINNILEYLMIFKSLNTVNVQRRYDLLERLYLPDDIFDFELLLWGKIKSGYYDKLPIYFWDLVSRHSLVGDVREIFNRIRPTDSDISNKILDLPLPIETQDDFISNLTGVKALYKEITSLS